MHEWVYGEDDRRRASPGNGDGGGGGGGGVGGGGSSDGSGKASEEAESLQTYSSFRTGDIAARLAQLWADASQDGAYDEDVQEGPPSVESEEDEDEEELEVM